ncbi:hypothetical protein AYR66_02155 [Noviherbaspirillum denitrificans]|uniref:Uncharacterized protein n=1 Tax=Noviherbaspirillum denitrificans TaxID=1968433 RepID=A0A254TCJ4_9BURK|nr:hypothetical protein AYR66_02155 [Noviherbaspirillum denitrificans]
MRHLRLCLLQLLREDLRIDICNHKTLIDFLQAGNVFFQPFLQAVSICIGLLTRGAGNFTGACFGLPDFRGKFPNGRGALSKIHCGFAYVCRYFPSPGIGILRWL